MDQRAAGKIRCHLGELVDAALHVAAFCAAAGPLVAQAVPSATGAAATPTWYSLDPRSLLVNGVYGPIAHWTVLPRCVGSTSTTM